MEASAALISEVFRLTLLASNPIVVTSQANSLEVIRLKLPASSLEVTRLKFSRVRPNPVVTALKLKK